MVCGIRRWCGVVCNLAVHQVCQPNLGTWVLPPKLPQLRRIHEQHDEAQSHDQNSAGNADAKGDYDSGFKRACYLEQRKIHEVGEHGANVCMKIRWGAASKGGELRSRESPGLGGGTARVKGLLMNYNAVPETCATTCLIQPLNQGKDLIPNRTLALSG
jgi:hypothetical protein